MATASPEPNGGDRERLWNYLAYRVLRRLDGKQHDWRSVTSGQFSKLPCIADHYLIDQLDRRIDFPRYWYKYGEVANREPLNNSLFIIEEADWGGLEVRPAKPDQPFNDIDEEIRADIDEAVDFVVDNFANVKIDRVKELQYDYFAPNDFIRAFDRLREQVYDLSEAVEKVETMETEERRTQLIDLLGEVISLYPEATYEQMAPDFVDWAITMRLLFDTGEVGRAEAQLEEFWEVFSKVHLRMEHNTKRFPDQEDRWRAENQFRLERYRESLAQVKNDVVQKIADSEQPEEIEESVTAAVRDLME